MKYQTTKKSLNTNYYKIISIGYCNAHYLLKYISPQSYCVGVYGWSCDNYDIGGVLVSTGYNPLSSKNVITDYEHIMKFENKARSIVCNYELSYDQMKRKVTALLNKFIKECTQ